MGQRREEGQPLDSMAVPDHDPKKVQTLAEYCQGLGERLKEEKPRQRAESAFFEHLDAIGKVDPSAKNVTDYLTWVFLIDWIAPREYPKYREQFAPGPDTASDIEEARKVARLALAELTQALSALVGVLEKRWPRKRGRPSEIVRGIWDDQLARDGYDLDERARLAIEWEFYPAGASVESSIENYKSWSRKRSARKNT